MKNNWVDEEIAFYDFIWEKVTKENACKVNEEFMEDFQNGGNKFNRMVDIIKRKWRTREDAMADFKRSIK